MPRLCIMPARALDDERLSNQDLRAILAVGYHASLSGKGVWASNKTLAERARLDERDFRRCVARLIEWGYVRRTTRIGADGRQQTSFTDVVLDEAGGGVQDPGGEGFTDPRGGGVPTPHQTKAEERGPKEHHQHDQPKIRDRFTAPHHRAAYDTVIAGNPRGRAAVHYELLLRAEGGERPGEGLVPAAGWDRVGEALHQLAVAGRAFSTRSLGTYLEGLDGPAPRPTTRSSNANLSANSFERWIAENSQGDTTDE
jgi:hypothetical protein